MNYPTPQDTVAIEAAEKLMEGVMANYDPSHDKYHGEFLSPFNHTRRTQGI